jgi:hypothetical protein
MVPRSAKPKSATVVMCRAKAMKKLLPFAEDEGVYGGG